MSLPLVGELALWVAFLFAAWGVVTSAAAGPLGRAEFAVSGTRALHAAAVMLMLALLALTTSLFRRDFTVAYVAAFGGATATTHEMVIALWAAPPGALLALGVVMAAMASVAATDREPAVSATLQLVLLGVLATLLSSESPFERLSYPAGDGRGLPPQLRGSVSLFAWPLWAFAAGAAAAAFALATGSALDAVAADRLARKARRWVLVAWILHSAALLLALWWSYGLASGEQTWRARAVHPGAVAAWLALGVAAHIVFIEQRWRIRLRARTVLLALPLPLVLISAMLGAEGSWQPLHELVHGIAGAWWIVLAVATLQVLAYAVVRARGTEAATKPRLDTWEGHAPGAEDGATPERMKGGRMLGARLAHVAVVIAILGLLAGAGTSERIMVLDPGDDTVATDALRRDWRVVYQGLSTGEGRTALGEVRWRQLFLPVAIAPAGAVTDQELLVPEIREHVDLFGRATAPPWPRPAIQRGALQDIIIEPDSIGDGEGARLRIAFVPLPGLIWLGGLALILGGILSLAGESR